MTCPYCRKDVDDGATVCAFCQRDLILYSPIAKSCARTERGLTALQESLGQVDVGPASAIVASIVLAFSFDYVSWLPFASGWIQVPFQALGVLAPIFAAIVFGIFSGAISTTACSALGIIAGFGGFAAHVFVWAFGALQSAYTGCALNGSPNQSCDTPDLLPSHWYLSIITYPVAGALLFISGHAFGRMQVVQSPFQKWKAGDESVSAEQNQSLPRIIEVVIGVLTAVLPKLIEFLLESPSH
jgi:hypothetical protein